MKGYGVECDDIMAAGGFSVFAGVGERTREGNDLYKEMIESVQPFLSAVIFQHMASGKRQSGML